MINQPELAQLKIELERHLMIFEPSELLPRYIKSTHDIYKNSSILKLLPCTNFTIRYLAHIVLTDVEARKRFRRVECLKGLRAIVRNCKGPPQLKPEIIRLLFGIYKKLIFEVPENGQWAASVLIKDQLLTDEEIQWLIENCKQSMHLLNRLLLYPERHPAIMIWAEKAYKAREFPDREGEIIALIIQDDIPLYVNQSDINLILKAISRARVPDVTKEALLKKYSNHENYDTLLDIALRLKMPSLIRYMIAEV
ncbi:MAG: hypothetical protein HS126_15215 [Anaerolineales bacterium]|nr:hypothetical protein [Anaerolineales bacterium]